ncbi:MAG: protease inhibitor I42 family protein [Bacillota bacterium]
MRRSIALLLICFFVSASVPVFAEDGLYNSVLGNSDLAYSNYSLVVTKVNEEIDDPTPICLLIFAGTRNGAPFLDIATDTITVYSGQPLYITPISAIKGQITVRTGADFSRYFQENADISMRADKAYTALKSGHTEIEVTYQNLSKKITVNVITWKNFSLINDQLRTTAFVGDIFFVKLPSDPKSGYDWYLSPLWNNDVFQVLETGYTNPDVLRADKLKDHYWLIRAKVAGQGDMKFEYRLDKKNYFVLEDCSIKATVEGY